MDDAAAATSVPVLALVRDLLFASKISGAASSRGLPAVKIIRDPAKLLGQAGRRLLVDLNLDGAIEAAAAWQREQSAEVVGFLFHVDAETIARARAAGIERVVARGQFAQTLDNWLR